MITQDEIKAGLDQIKAIASTIKDLKEVPSGHLYAQCMGFLSLESYTKIINILKNAGLVSEQNNLLKWELES